jgi:hypothetical protein
VPKEDKDKICNMMTSVKIVISHTKYLGLPLVFGRSKKEISTIGVLEIFLFFLLGLSAQDE